MYFPHAREALTYHYERDADDPRIAHSFTLEVDAYGAVRRTAAAVYGRRSPAYTEQGQFHVTLDEADVFHLDDTDDVLRLAVPTESRSYELHGLPPPGTTPFTWAAMFTAAYAATPLAYDGTPTTGFEKRLLARSRSRYLADDLSAPLSHGIVHSKALPYDSDVMAMTEAQRVAVFGSLTGAPTNTQLQDDAKYILDDSAWWIRTGHPTYDPSKFYAVTAVVDPWGNSYSTTYDSHTLLTVSSTDPLGNTVTAAHDYRLLTPWQVTDPNGNRGQVEHDILGFVVKSAVLGKVGDSDGDTLADPTTTFEYDLFAWQTAGTPNWSKSRVRETHQDPSTRWLEQRSYFSGAGGVVMVKAQARPGLAPERDGNGELVFVNGELQYADTSPDLRWVGNGRVVKDNKGNVLKAYEPYYSSTPDYEDEAELVEQGVTALNHYDPLGRLIRTDLPNGTFSTVSFDPWTQTTADPNDNTVASDWYTARIGYGGSDPALVAERRAAEQAALHNGTPTVVHLDSLGRPFLSVAHNKDGASNLYYATKSVLDIQGNVLEVVDARSNTAEERVYGMLGQSLKVVSIDAGDRWHLLDALGQPFRSWDSRDQRFSFTYDTARRPVDRTVSVGGAAEKLLGRVVYGDLLATPTTTNHAGRVYRVYDGAGVATTAAFDFKGHPTSESRQLVSNKTTEPDWSALLGQSTIAAMATAAAAQLDAETFTASSTRDALGRVLTAISPDGSEVAYGYDEGGGLQTVELKHRGSTTAQTVVGDITYDARGQRTKVVYGSTSSPTSTTRYTYDPETFRLSRLWTERGSDSAGLQSLHYHYDPVGNVTDIRDTAQQTVYFQNSVVTAANSYTYDAVYRLVEATGREHSADGTAQRTHAQLPVGPQPMTSDPSAMRRYTQQYTYDAVGNLLTMQHIPTGGTGWTRHYDYATDGNRLLGTSAPGDPPGTYSHTYTYDAHGSMTSMPHLSSMVWGHDDALQQVTVGTETVSFQYAGGIRSRKYVEKSGAVTEERIYLGPWEVYRKRVSGALDVERESLHVSDGSGRMLLVETKTVDGGTPVSTPVGVWRFQLGNLVGSAVGEIDASGAVISYEEYHPYGTSAYRAVDSSIDVSAKRYRYTGMERDEETGLGYHSARYYAPWLGRWTASDPIGLGDGVNRYGYAGNAGVGTVDRSGNSGVTVVAGAAPEYEGSSAPGNWEPIASTVDGEGNAATEWLWIEAGSAEESSVAARDAQERPKQGRTSPAAAMKGGSAGADGGIDWGRVARATPHAFVLGQGVGFLKGSWNTATALPKLGIGLIGDYDGTVSGLKQTWREDGLLGFTPFGDLGDKIVETGVQLGEGNLYAAGEAWGEGAVAAQNSAGMVYGGGLLARWSLGKLFSRQPRAPRGMIDEAAGGEFVDDAIRGPDAVESAAPKGGADRQALGMRREGAVAESIGGKVAKTGNRDLKLTTSKGEGVTVDVLGPEGELIVVGGPAKAKGLGALGDRLRVLREAAGEKGVKAQAFFEEGTPDSVLKLAEKFLGAENVRTFPKVGR